MTIRTQDAFEAMYQALRATEISLIGDEDYQKFKPLLKTVRDALAKAEPSDVRQQKELEDIQALRQSSRFLKK